LRSLSNWKETRMSDDIFRIRGLTRRLPTMRDISVRYAKGPYIGVTQGGSSRSNAAIVAATKGEARASVPAGYSTLEEPNDQ